MVFFDDTCAALVDNSTASSVHTDSSLKHPEKGWPDNISSLPPHILLASFH